MNEWQLRLGEGSAAQRFALTQRMHLLGSGRSCDIPVTGWPLEAVQLWRDGESYRMVRMGPPGAVRWNGVDADERVLADGDRIECAGIAARFERRGSEAGATSAPIAAGATAASAIAPAPIGEALSSRVEVASSTGPRWIPVAAAAWVAEQGKLAKATQQKWEKVLKDGTSWNAEECAADVLAGASLDDRKPQAVVNALRDALAKRLIRDAHRGIARKRFVARLIVQIFVLAVLASALTGVALVLRSTQGLDFNRWLDGLLDLLRKLAGGVT